MPLARDLDGAAVALSIRDRVTLRAANFQARAARPVGLSVVLVGDDPASHVYVRKKEEAAREAGLLGTSIRLPATATQDEVLRAVDALNADASVDGILVQLPLPKQVDSDIILARLDPAKDVDGFHPVNVGRLWLGLPACRPCTPAGVMVALAHHGIELSGARAVVIGRSNIVGKPMAALLIEKNATVTVCHSRTKDLVATCREADVLVAAIGRPGFVTAEFVRPGATVIDVGINRLARGKDDVLAERMLGKGSKRHARFVEKGDALVGDVDYLSAREVAGLITPVPGGVGPLTIAMLLQNTVDAACWRLGLEV